MPTYVLSFKPAIGQFGVHDPSAAIFEDGDLIFAVEEERYTREKHAAGTFPESAIEACLEYYSITLQDVERIVLPYEPHLKSRVLRTDLRRTLTADDPLAVRLQNLERIVESQVGARFFPTRDVEARLREFGTPLPAIETRSHHRCHAASAFHPSGFEEALVLTIDGHGEYDATVVWDAGPDGLERLRTYEIPNSLGHFFGVITEFLGYHAFNGEGKVMGLAPYGDQNDDIDAVFDDLVDGGVDYDVSSLTAGGWDDGVERLERAFDRERNRTEGKFDDWERDLAWAAQRFVEDTVTDIVTEFCRGRDRDTVCLAGGVALNCKMNKQVMDLDAVKEVFIQPAAHDGGLVIGGGFVDQAPADVERMETVYWGPEYDDSAVRDLLEANKVSFETPTDLPGTVAELLADGELVGWFQGRLEMGPRALGNRSILADPRTEASRDRVNEFVKHREDWRPFAPSMLESAVEEYLVDGEPAPFMIKTFDVNPVCRSEMEAVVHPADGTTRPQTVSAEQNPRYHALISAFYDRTGVPVVLNTSFNDHAEPIVNTPKEALKDFFGMGLDAIAIGDHLVHKGGSV